MGKLPLTTYDFNILQSQVSLVESDIKNLFLLIGLIWADLTIGTFLKKNRTNSQSARWSRRRRLVYCTHVVLNMFVKWRLGYIYISLDFTSRNLVTNSESNLLVVSSGNSGDKYNSWPVCLFLAYGNPNMHTIGKGSIR